MFCLILLWFVCEKYLKYYYAFIYSILYGGSIITYDLATSEDFSRTSIPNSPIFLITFESSIILSILILYYRCSEFNSIHVLDKLLLLASGCFYCIFIILMMLTISMTSASFANNSEFLNIIFTFISELLLNKNSFKNIPIIVTIVLSGILANYGLLRFDNDNVKLGYLISCFSLFSENISGILNMKVIKISQPNRMILMMLGIFIFSFTASLINFFYFKITSYYNWWIYLHILINILYITNYIYVVKTFGIVFDSITCSLAIFYSFLFTILENSDVNDLFVAIFGTSLLIINILNYIQNHANHEKVDFLKNAYNISSDG